MKKIQPLKNSVCFYSQSNISFGCVSFTHSKDSYYYNILIVLIRSDSLNSARPKFILN